MPATPDKPTRLSIIAAALPPTLDGIGDYSALLSEELARNPQISVEVLTDCTRPHDTIAGVSIRGILDPNDARSVSAIGDALRESQPDWAILQYNPFSYGRRGLNLHLPRLMRRVREYSPNTKLAVMFHEMYVPMNSWKFAAMTPYQRWQYFQLARAADVVFVSIEPWAQRTARLFKSKPVYHLPVGSNIPRVAIDSQEARARLGVAEDEIIVGVFGTAHVSRLLHLIGPAAQAVRSAGCRVRLLYVGPDEQTVRKYAGDVPLICGGCLSPAEVSNQLSAVDIFLATYIDGISTRRGAMMAGLQHGLAIVGTQAFNTDTELRDLHEKAMLLVEVGDTVAFERAIARLAADRNLRVRLGQGAANWFNNHYAWPVIAQRMMSGLATAPRQ